MKFVGAQRRRVGLVRIDGPPKVRRVCRVVLWFVIATDLGLLSGVAAGVALLVRSRAAVWLFALSLIAIVVDNIVDLAAKTSLALTDAGWRNLTVTVVIVAALQLTYAWAMKKRSVLR